MRLARVLSMMNVHSWSDYALHLVNSAANIVAIVAAALVLISLAFIYFTGSELTGRAKGKDGAPGRDHSKSLRRSEKELAAARKSETAKALRLTQVEAGLAKTQQADKAKASQLAETEKQVAAARKSDEAKTLRVTQVEAELVKTRKSEEAKAIRVTQIEAELAAAQKSEEGKAIRVTEIERELAGARRSEEAKTIRLAELEAELATLRRSAEEATKQMEAELAALRHSTEEARTLAKNLEGKQGPRKITPEQRTQFLNAVRGQPTGKIIVSAFFDNEETHDFGAEILGLLKEAGFDVVERAPVNFFTTSRPSSGLRIGTEHLNNGPAHFYSVKEGFRAMGLETPTTSLINAKEDDVVEVQVTPRQ